MSYARIFGTRVRLALSAAALGAVALPVAGALATPEDPTQPAAHDHGAHADHGAETAAPAAALSDAQVAASRALFNQYSCGACHTLGHAGGTGQIGPSFDGNSALTKDYLVRIISNGQGAMPSFGGMISAGDIDQMASYIMQVKR